jgi:hypothetical protein
MWEIIRNAWRNRRPRVIAAILFAGIPTCTGISQPQSEGASVHNVARGSPIEDRVSPAPESLLKRFSNDLNVSVSAHIVTSPGFSNPYVIEG